MAPRARLLAVERRALQNLRHAENTVQRRADFMTHAREKLRLGLVGGFGRPLRFGQLGVARHQTSGQRFQDLHHRPDFVSRIRSDPAARQFHRRRFGVASQGPQGVQHPPQEQNSQQTADHQNGQRVKSRSLPGLRQQLIGLGTVEHRDQHIHAVDDRQWQIGERLVFLPFLPVNRRLHLHRILDCHTVQVLRFTGRFGQNLTLTGKQNQFGAQIATDFLE